MSLPSPDLRSKTMCLESPANSSLKPDLFHNACLVVCLAFLLVVGDPTNRENLRLKMQGKVDAENAEQVSFDCVFESNFVKFLNNP